MDEIGPLEIGEIKAVSFDFTSEAGADAVLNTPTLEVVLLDGTDPAPSAVKVGSPSIVGPLVVHLVKPGVSGCTYVLRAHVKDATGQEHNIPCLLRVVPA